MVDSPILTTLMICFTDLLKSFILAATSNAEIKIEICHLVISKGIVLFFIVNVYITNQKVKYGAR